MTLEIVPVVLDELVLTVVVDNATDNLSSVDSGAGAGYVFDVPAPAPPETWP